MYCRICRAFAVWKKRCTGAEDMNVGSGETENKKSKVREDKTR